VALIAIVGAGSASATVLCKKNATPCGGEVWGKGQEFKSSSEGELVYKFKGAFGEYSIACAESTLNGSISNAGGENADVLINIEEFTLANCTCPQTAVLENGSLAVAWTSGTMNGTLTVANMEVTFKCMGHCTYGGGKFGTLTGGVTGTIDVAATLNKTAGEFACPTTANLTGSYKVTSPAPFYVAEK
jgi:hypothetical protein